MEDLAKIFILLFVVSEVQNHENFKAFHVAHYSLAKREIVYC